MKWAAAQIKIFSWSANDLISFLEYIEYTHTAKINSRIRALKLFAGNYAAIIAVYRKSPRYNKLSIIISFKSLVRPTD